MKDIFLEIKWSKSDIQKMLEENGKDSSEEVVDKFLNSFDIKYLEEVCIQTGWEMIQSAL